MINIVINITLILTAALSLAALSGYFSEKSGIANIAIEAFMVFGAMGYALLYPALVDSLNGAAIIPSLLFAGVTGAIGAAIFSLLTINLKSDHIISGTALNILAPALTMAVIKILTNGSTVIQLFLPTNLPDVFGIWGRTIVLIAFSLVFVLISIFINKKTVLGMRIKASGEHPQALASAGVSVYKVRWIALMISGVLGGFAGGVILFSIGNQFNGSVQGFGFIAVAILVLGSWKVKRVSIFSVVFAFLIAFATWAMSFSWFKDIFGFIPEDGMKMMPFLLPVIVLAFTSKRSRTPKAVGQIYDESKR